MVKNILNTWIVDKKKSIIIGDKTSDLKCAEKSNLYFEFVEKDLLQQIKKLN